MRPVLADERCQRVDIGVRERVRHFLRQRAHATEREEHFGVAALVCARHGHNRVAGDARLAGIDDEAATLEFFTCLTSEWNLTHVRTTLREAQRKPAAEC